MESRRFYISAKWHLKDTVSAMRDRLVAEGHTIPIDWTTRAFARDYAGFGQSREFAEEEVQAILDADVFIHLSDMGGKGKYVDLGIAIAGNHMKKSPLVYVLGSKADESQFYFHPTVTRIVAGPLEGLEEILSGLQEIARECR